MCRGWDWAGWRRAGSWRRRAAILPIGPRGSTAARCGRPGNRLHCVDDRVLRAQPSYAHRGCAPDRSRIEAESLRPNPGGGGDRQRELLAGAGFLRRDRDPGSRTRQSGGGDRRYADLPFNGADTGNRARLGGRRPLPRHQVGCECDREHGRSDWILGGHCVAPPLPRADNGNPEPDTAQPAGSRRSYFLRARRVGGFVPWRRRWRRHGAAGCRDRCGSDAPALHRGFWSGQRLCLANHIGIGSTLSNQPGGDCSQRVPGLPAGADGRPGRPRRDRSLNPRAFGARQAVPAARSNDSRSLADIGKLRWRVLMLTVILAVLFVPLSRALMQVRNETVARGAIREAVRQIASQESVVSEMIDLTPERIRIRLILTDAVPAEKIEAARRLILKRTGKDVDLFVRKVAGEDELALLRERLKPAPPTPLEDLEGVRRELVARLEQPLREAWPGGSAALLGYELGFSPADVVVRVRYQAPDAFDEAASSMLRNILQGSLHVDRLRLEMAWVQPEAPPPPVKASRAPRKARKR